MVCVGRAVPFPNVTLASEMQEVRLVLDGHRLMVVCQIPDQAHLLCPQLCCRRPAEGSTLILGWMSDERELGEVRWRDGGIEVGGVGR